MEDISIVDVAAEDEDWNTQENIFHEIQNMEKENSSFWFLPFFFKWNFLLLLGVPIIGDRREDQGVDDIQQSLIPVIHEPAEDSEQHPVQDTEDHQAKVESLEGILGQICWVC